MLLLLLLLSNPDAAVDSDQVGNAEAAVELVSVGPAVDVEDGLIVFVKNAVFTVLVDVKLDS